MLQQEAVPLTKILSSLVLSEHAFTMANPRYMTWINPIPLDV